MTKQEFIDRLPEGAKAPSDSEYNLIEKVYTYHPSIHEVEGKKQIAYLYSTFGMRIIKDMLETARQAQTLITQIENERAMLKHLEYELELLSEI